MELLLPFLVGFLVTAISVIPTITFAKKYKLLNYPDNKHPGNIQSRVIPRAGGLACFIGIFLSIIVFLQIEKHILGILIALTILLIVGLADDKYKNLSPYIRLLVQFVAALVVVGSGVGINFITHPFGGIIRLDTIILPFDFFGVRHIFVVADLLALVWIVWVMNMINWSKGVDGQMPGIVAVAAIFLGILSVKLALLGDASQIDIAKLSFITAGTAIGLLIFNWHPAKILPGFSGSTILGFMIAVLAILSGAKLATAGLVLLVPATDFVYTFFRRIAQKKSPVWGDRGHLHHRLLDLGLTHQQISLFYIIGGVILGTIALSLDSRGKLFAAALIGISVLGGILWLNFFGGLSKPHDQDSG